MEQALRIKEFADIDTSKICYWFEQGLWWIYLPKCGVGNLSNHTIVENSSHTITVTPSILVKGHNKGQTLVRHGYLTDGIWKEC